MTDGGSPHLPSAVLTAALASGHAAEGVPIVYKIATEDLQDDDLACVDVARRIKETLLKGSVLFGIPPTLEGAFALQNVLREEARTHPARSDAGYFLRQGQTLAEVEERGYAQLNEVYRHNFEEISKEKFRDDMQDIRFLTMQINYGWNLSENSVLDFATTELVILAALIPQNFRAETLWHLRGSRRAGWSDAVIESVRSVALDIAKFLGRPTHKVPDLKDVSEDRND